jgi:hypothetical protein
LFFKARRRVSAIGFSVSPRSKNSGEFENLRKFRQQLLFRVSEKQFAVLFRDCRKFPVEIHLRQIAGVDSAISAIAVFKSRQRKHWWENIFPR